MAVMMKSIELNNNVGKRKKNEDAESEYLSQNKKKARRVVWSADLDSKFVNAVELLGENHATPKKIVAMMKVDGITTAHVASHLQKYRLRNKKAADAERVPSRMTRQPTQSQNINIHSSFNFHANQQTSTLLHPSDTLPAEIYSNMSGVPPSTLIQSQNINNSPLIIHPSPSTFPTYHHISTLPNAIHQSTTQLGLATAFDFNDVGTFVGSSSTSTSINSSFNTEIYSSADSNMSGLAPSTLIQPIQSQNIDIHPPSSAFPMYQSSSFPTVNVNPPLGFATGFNFHDVRTFVGSSSSTSTSINSSFNTEIYSSAGLDMNGVAPSTLIQPTQSQNINIHPPPSNFPISHQTSSLFPTPLGFPTAFHFHDNRATTNCPLQISNQTHETHDVVAPASSKTTNIWDYNWYTKFAHNSLPVRESDKTSQMNSQTSTLGAACLEDTNIDISYYNLCTDNSPIDFSF